MTCYTLSVSSRSAANLTCTSTPLAALSVQSCRTMHYTPLSTKNDKFDLGSFHRNEVQPVQLHLVASSGDSTTDISGATVTLQVWDYSSGVAALCFEKENGIGITIKNASATNLELYTQIEPTDYTGMTPQLPNFDVRLEVVIWVDINGVEQVLGQGHYISKPDKARG